MTRRAPTAAELEAAGPERCYAWITCGCQRAATERAVREQTAQAIEASQLRIPPLSVDPLPSITEQRAVHAAIARYDDPTATQAGAR